MKKINIEEVSNGYKVDFNDTIKNDGEYVYRTTQEYEMLELVCKMILGYPVKVERR